MRKIAPVVTGLTCTATDIAIMQILITTFSAASRGNDTWPNLAVWLICGGLCYLINLAVLKRSVSVPLLAGLNAILLAALLYANISNAMQLSGFLNHVFIVLFSVVTVVDSMRLAMHPVSLIKQLRKFDAMIFTMIWLFLNYASGIPMTDLPLFMVILMLNLICNVALRALERNVGGALSGSPVAGPLLYCVFVGCCVAAVYFLVRLLSSGSQVMVTAVLFAIKTAVLAVFGVLGRFFSWLASLIPYSELDAAEMEMEVPASMDEAGEMEFLEASPVLMYVLVGAIAVVAVAVLLFFIYRMRKTRIKLSIRKNDPGVGVRRKRSSGAFRRRVLMIFGEIKFAITSVLRRNTPPGMLVKLERWGKKHDIIRDAGESMREYLFRLSPEGGLLPLAVDLNSIYFGCNRQSLSKPECKKLRREFFRRSRETRGRFRRFRRA